MKRIENYMLPENTNRLYREEASSAIGLMREIAKKINELVDAYNAISVNDLEWKQTQEGTIRKGILYMKDNLVNTLDSLMRQLQETGFIDRRILENMSDFVNQVSMLSNRLNNSLNGLTEDSEVIDSRVDVNGFTWNNSGQAIRMMTGTLKNMLKDVVAPECASITGVGGVGYYGTGGVYNSNSAYYYIKVPVTTGKAYFVHSNYGYAVPAVVALDSNDNFIQAFLTKGDGTTTEDFEQYIVAPEGCSYFIVNGRTADHPLIREIERWSINVDNMSYYLDNLTSIFTGEKEKLSEDVAPAYSEGHVITANRIVDVAFSDGIKPVITEIAVTAGERYHIVCSYAYENQPYLMVDSFGEVVQAPASADGSANVVIFDDTVVIPFGCTKLIIANQLTVNNPHCYKVLGYTSAHKSWDHLKWCCFGDSLTEVNTRATKRYYDYIQEKTGISILNCGVGGSGYARGSGENTAFYQRINTVDTDCDVVTFFGSFNDLGSGLSVGSATDTGTSTIAGCINTTLDNLYARMPLVSVGIIAPCPWESTKPATSGNAFNYVKVLKEICELRSIPFLDLWRSSNLRPWDTSFKALTYTKDNGGGVHPDETGHKIISGRIYSFLESIIATY